MNMPTGVKRLAGRFGQNQKEHVSGRRGDGRWWSLFLVALMAALVLFCRGTGRVKGGPSEGVDVLSNAFAPLAGQMAAKLPKESRVVVANFERQGRAQSTRLGAYLAKRFTVALSHAGAMIIDRTAGEKTLADELLFTVNRMDCKALLEHFQAAWGVFATYDLREDSGVELSDVKAVSTTGAETPFVGGCLVKAGASDLSYWQKLEGELLPNMSPRLARFFAESGKWNVVETPRLELGSGEAVAANGSIPTGATYRARVRLKEPAFVYVLGWDQTNSILTVLFPARDETPAQPAGEILLPPKGFMRADPPAGYNILKVIAARKEVGLLSSGESFLSDPALQTALVDSIEKLGSDNWGSANAGYYISDK